ncbi:NAD-dependent epimerase/dehydratase family protein [Mediterraneibacter faecis]|uniref:NAD-dependent epimerase/dehydratase family protein n=1 Tax=Mediterraneibacter faecis TaxID=592978 RepID=UPI003F9D389A
MIDNSIYKEDIKYVANLEIPWEKLRNKSILITGASGLIGSFLIDVLMEKNCMVHGLNCKVYALGRNLDKAKSIVAQLSRQKSKIFIMN